MKNKYFLFVFILLAVALATSQVVLAKKGNPPVNPNSNVGVLELLQKTPSGDWPPVSGGDHGTLVYHKYGPEFRYSFSAENLPEEDYTLIYYPDPWPGSNLICLASGATNGGILSFKGSLDTGSLPSKDDANYGVDPMGAKIWLVLSSDVSCEATAQMMGWHPESYLFEEKLINYHKLSSVDLFSKDSGTWEVIDGASGRLEYNESGPEFRYGFTGQGLVPSTEYSLIYYGDPWPGNHPGALIANGTTDEFGAVSIEGSVDLGMDLPDPLDANTAGAKIWLVPSGDYDAVSNIMTAWNPDQYLFENALINYDKTPL